MRRDRRDDDENRGRTGADFSAHGERDLHRPVYYISVVAEMVETHPQTLRMYERVGLIAPRRTRNNVRLYSEADVEQVRRIQFLTQEVGVNLAGIEMIFDMMREMQRMREQLEEAINEREVN